MKIKDISLQNFSNYENVTISLDENVTYLIGKNGSGKSTLGITAIWFIMQGIAEKSSNGNSPLLGERFRFIGPKGASAKGAMTLVDEAKGIEIKVARKLTKSGSELSFIAPEGMELTQQWLNDLFNVFMISPKSFTELTGVQQAKAIGIDTSTFDKEILELKEKAKTIRAELKPYDTLVEVEKADPVNMEALQSHKNELQAVIDNAFSVATAKNKETREKYEARKKQIDAEVKEFNEGIDSRVDRHTSCTEAYNVLRAAGCEMEKLSQVNEWIQSLITDLPEKKHASTLYPNLIDLNEGPEDPTTAREDDFVLVKLKADDSALKQVDEQIITATETNRKAMLYSQYVQKKAEKEKKEAELAANVKAQQDKANDRIKYIQSLKLPFSNLTVDDDGQLMLKDKTGQFKPIKEPYFSTGEILKIIPILVAHQNPELKYVFIQGFRDLDEDNWAQIESHLLEKGFQIVVEVVGKEKINEKNCILLKDNVIVESYDEQEQPSLNL